MKQLYVPMVMAVMSAFLNSGLATPTRGPYGGNLNGKMLTLSPNRGGVTFYSPYFYPTSTPWPSSTPYQTRGYTTPNTPNTITQKPPETLTTPKPTTTTTKPTTTTTPPTTYPPWTTASTKRGVSVCLRYLTDSSQKSPLTLFMLSPSGRAPLQLKTNFAGWYALSFDLFSWNDLSLRPNIRLWTTMGQGMWTRVCLTVDTMKNVAQVFSGSSMSVRKMLRSEYVWSGEPVIEFPGFDGQVTDVQVWDYPLRYSEIYNYMNSRVYSSYSGSVLTWSSISYSPRGNALLEDVYELQAKEPISRRGRGRRPDEERKTSEFFNGWEREDRRRQQL